MSGGRTVDANVHVVSPDLKRYPVSPRRGAMPAWAEGSADDLLPLMADAGVDQVVLVHSAAIYGDDPRYTLDCAQQHPQHFAALVGVDTADPRACERLRQLVDDHGLDGIRFERGDGKPAAAWLASPVSLQLWQEAARLGIFVALPTARKLDAIPALRDVLERFPTVPVVLRQLMGVSDTNTRELFDVSEFSNVYFSFSLDNIEAARHSTSTPQSLFETFIQRFGANHFMWGSFYPAHRGPAGTAYRGVIGRVRHELAFLPPADRECLLGGTARTLFPSLSGARR